jgi:hypothetical protein
MKRILMAADPAAARLISIALNKRTKHGDAISAIRDLLNRAGVHAKPEDIATDNGQVLWDEFIQIHRRRIPVADE